jgi:peptidyl-prolyl cis-trans isomerase C
MHTRPPALTPALTLAACLSIALLPLSVLAADKPVAVVNGQPISQQTYQLYLKQRQAENPNANVAGNRKIIINELINRELLYQDAVKQKLDKDPDVKFTLEQLRKNTLIQANVRKMARDKPITDAALKKEYDTRIATADITEYKARHILLKSEADAKAVIKELDNGAVFSDVAKAKSTGPTGPKGGDLGWFKASQMVGPFAEAVKKMNKGSYTKTPVKTQFGWHVILLEDSRKATPPAFEQVKNQIRSVMRSRQLQERIMKMRKQAKIEIK